MGFFRDWYTNPGPGIEKDEPEKKGIALFFSILGREFWGLVKVNLLFLLFCLPIITIPSAITALSGITLSMVRDEPYDLWQDFSALFRRNFVRATISGWIVFSCIGLLLYALFFYAGLLHHSMIYYGMMIVSGSLLLLAVGSGQYIFPLLILRDLKITDTFKNALLLCAACLFRTLLAILVIGILIAGVLILFPLSIPICFVGFFAILNLISIFCAYTGMKKYVL